MMILEMLESGKITSTEAQVLFRALGEEESEEVDDILGVEAPQPTESRQHHPEPRQVTLKHRLPSLRQRGKTRRWWPRFCLQAADPKPAPVGAAAGGATQIPPTRRR